MGYARKEDKNAHARVWMKTPQAKATRKAWKMARVAEFQARVNEIKARTPCADCQEKFPAVCMDFDHLENDKTDDVSRLILHCRSWEAIEQEILKCQLVCANCHRVRTSNRRQKD